MILYPITYIVMEEEEFIQKCDVERFLNYTEVGEHMILSLSTVYLSVTQST
jgi:hypothetical protein